ncbi:metal-dependent hydrolase [Synechococcus elongatus]|uniref:metal-dependent hydrolase n=1 Tax=Synechococcus elongatus TaxID=32046 RepID=UPI0030D23FCB
MMALTHSLASACGVALCLGTASPLVIGVGAIAGQLPDADTSHSWMGRLLFPISRRIEQHWPHRTLTHSLVATGAIALLFSPVIFISLQLWGAVVLGYSFGWFADCFTKTGVAAFWPYQARLVIPANPRLRLSTGSRIEFLLVFVLAVVLSGSLLVNSGGGLMRSIEGWMGMPASAVELVLSEGDRWQLQAEVWGVEWLSQQPITGKRYRVISAITQIDVLLQDDDGWLYRAGQSQEAQLRVWRLRVERVRPIQVQLRTLELNDLSLNELDPPIPKDAYLSGVLELDDEPERIPDPFHFEPLTLQPLGNGRTLARLESAPPDQLLPLIGDSPAKGRLVARRFLPSSGA